MEFSVDDAVRFGAPAGPVLAGTLALPPGKHAVPGIVLVGGSGPSDRDNDGFFAPLREQFLRAGAGVLSYDKRGVGDSAGDWGTATVDELAADTVAALACLRSRPRIAGERVAVFGHSEGGWVALRAALTFGPGVGVVLNSCPAVSFLDSETYALRARGWSQHDADGARQLLQRLADLSAAGSELSAGAAALADVHGEQWFARFDEAGFILDETMWAQVGIWGNYDPAPDLARMQSSTLVVLGAEDPLVPVQSSVGIYEATARLTGRQQSVQVFPGAGHRLALTGTDQLASGYLTALTQWLAATFS